MTMLMTPGPVPLTDEIREAQTKEMITHRCPEFSELYGDLTGRLRNYLNSEESYVITGSGALGLETLFLNLCLPSGKSICFPNGDFGNKLVLTAQVYSDAESHDIEGGKGWNLERVKEAIDNSDAPVLAMVQNETSYGIRNHVREICRYAKSKGMITIIDGISAWPGTPMDMKDYNIDGFVTGSQKGTGAPPGMALLGLSKEAVERFSSRDFIPGYYMDLRRHRKRLLKDSQTPNTPAISLFYSLQKAFDAIDAKGGLAGCIREYETAAAHVRKRLVEMGFGLIAEEGFESNTVTGFYCNSGDEAKRIRSGLLDDYNIRIVGSRGKYKENGLRIAHMGNFRMEDLDHVLDAIEKLRS
jgi:aspartate aminotransferase-like enzyme